MRNYSKLVATVEETGEFLVLQEGGSYSKEGFNRLAEILGKDYDNVNDDLMDGITDWGGVEWSHRIYKLGEVETTVTFTFTPIENN